MPGRGIKSAATALTAYCIDYKTLQTRLSNTDWLDVYSQSNPSTSENILYNYQFNISKSHLIVNQSSQTKIKAILIKK